MIFVSPLILYISVLWIFFFRNNFYSIRLKPSIIDKLQSSKILKKVNYNFVFGWNLNLLLYFFVTFIFFKIDYNILWFYHLKLNNFYLNVTHLLLFIFVLTFICLCFYKNRNINFNIDYFIAIFNLVCFVIVLFYSNNFYSFLFILELNSITIFYKFAVSNYWNKNEKKNISSNTKQYLNTIFFQYWANFFSSILLFFTLFNISVLFGSSEWIFINFVLNLNLNIVYFNNNLFYTIISIFFIGFFLKIGFTPSHLFKLEVYRGLPFFSILFYTTFYFFSFFLIFIIISFIYLKNINFIIHNIFILFTTIGGFYVLFLLFDINTTKIFFAYSTIVNVVNFLLFSMTLIN